MYPTNQYKNKSIDFPKHDVPFDQRGEDWHRKWCEAAYSLYLKDAGSIAYSKRREMKIHRLYAQGNQPVEKYKDILCPMDDKTNQRKGLMNISWDIFSLAPKYRSLVLGKFDKVHHDMTANAIDEGSGADKEAMKFGLWADKQLSGFFETIPEEYRSPDLLSKMMPESMEELEMYEKSGAFKLKEEIAIEKILKHSFDISYWDEEVKRKIYEDLYDIGVAACKDYVDKQTKKVKTRYVDAINLIVSNSRNHDLARNSTFVGEVTYPTIEQIRHDAGGQLSEEKLSEIAKLFRQYNNQNQYYGSYDYYANSDDDSTDGNGHSDIRGCVLELEWDSVRKITKATRTKNGKTVTKEVKEGDRIHKKNTKINTTQLKIVHTCKWVVGTPYVYDFGLAEDIPRPELKEANKSFHVYKHSSKSMQSQIEPSLDNIQFAVLKLRNAMATAVPRGIAIEFGSLQNMTMGEKKMSPMDLLSIRRSTGDLLYKVTSHHNKVKSSGYKPITETDGGIGPQLNEFQNIMETEISMINRILGFNELSAADTPQPRVGVGVSKIAEGATNNVLQNLYAGYKSIKQSTADNMFLRAQILIGSGQGEAYLKSIGIPSYNVVDIAKNISAKQMGIKIELKPNDAMKADAIDAAKASLAAGRQGGAGIGMSDYFYIVDMIENGNLKQAQMVLAFREAKEKERQSQIQKENMELNTQGAMQTEAMKAENKEKEMFTKAEAEAMLEEKKSELRMVERESSMVDDIERDTHKANLELRNNIAENKEE
jgi:hypothetical protein